MNAQTQIKMITSFQRGIYVPLVGPNAQPVNVYNYLKERNGRISLDHVRGLMDGREQMYKDFEVVTITDVKTLRVTESVPAASRIVEQANLTQPAQAATTSVAPVRKPMVPTGPQAATQISGSPQVARGRGRTYEPSGMVMPLKRGTVYAQLMEMLVAGATMKELLAATKNATAGGVNDVLSWQIKRRGYGLTFDQATGKYKLVFPQGHTKLAYSDEE